MPRRDWRLRIEDILDASRRIAAYTKSMTYETFVADGRTVDAVIRNLTVIGEAASHVPPEIRAEHAHIAWAEMRGIRNIVVHEYFGVDTQIL